MPNQGKIDVHGRTRRGDAERGTQDRFAVATLNKSLRVHTTNLSFDDESRLHGASQGHLFLVADRAHAADDPVPAAGSAIDRVFRSFLDEIPWRALDREGDGATERALDAALREASVSLPEGGALTIACVLWPELWVAHVGGTAAWLRRAGDLRPLASDDADAHEIRRVALEPGDVLALVAGSAARDAARVDAALAEDLAAEELCDRLLADDAGALRTAVVARFLPWEDALAGLADAPPPDPLTASEATPDAPPPTPPPAGEDPGPEPPERAPAGGGPAR